MVDSRLSNHIHNNLFNAFQIAVLAPYSALRKPVKGHARKCILGGLLCFRGRLDEAAFF